MRAVSLRVHSIQALLGPGASESRDVMIRMKPRQKQKTCTRNSIINNTSALTAAIIVPEKPAVYEKWEVAQLRTTSSSFFGRRKLRAFRVQGGHVKPPHLALSYPWGESVSYNFLPVL